MTLRIFALLLAVAFAAGLSTLYSFGVFKSKGANLDRSCVPVLGVAKLQDLQVNPTTRRAFLSSKGDGERGAVLALSIDDPLDSSSWRDITEGAPEAFDPRGLHYYENGDQRRLFVVNAAARSVEVFHVNEDGSLVHLYSHADKRLKNATDVVGVGPNSFYVTNGADAEHGGVVWAYKFLTRARAGSILYFNSVAFRVAAEGLRFAGGLAVSPDGGKLYVAETAGGALATYKRDPDNGHLERAERIRLEAAPEKLNVGDDGQLVVTGHPRPLNAAFRRGGEPPSIVGALTTGDAGDVDFTALYANDGADIAGVRAADEFDGKLLIGALQEDKFLICDAS